MIGKNENNEVEKINRTNRKSPASNSSKEADEGYCRSPSLPRTILGSQGEEEEDDQPLDNFAYLRKQAQSSAAKQSKSSSAGLKLSNTSYEDNFTFLRKQQQQHSSEKERSYICFVQI